MKLFHTNTKKKPAGTQVAKWVAQGTLLALILPASAFAVAPLDPAGNVVVPSPTLYITSVPLSGQPSCSLHSGISIVGLESGSFLATEMWDRSEEAPLGVWNCATNADQGITASTDIDRGFDTGSMTPNTSYIVYKTVGGAKIGFLKATTQSDAASATTFSSCTEVNAAVADACSTTTSTTSSPANIPVFGPLGLLASLTGLLWFGRRRQR